MASRDDFIQLFKLADKDNSGHLTLNELFDEMRKLGYRGTDDVLKSYFATADTSKDKKLNLEEFITSMSKAPPHVHRVALMRRVFAKFDKNGNGTLDKKELQNATAMLGDKFNDEDTAILMSIIDKDNSDTVDTEEFIQAFIEMRK
ncbi:hypothetical protein HELRODRAFT_185069 [Helobdella robusta]|uniref:EF-hand domain-containing protein n=1 Tax=Helobdella robusta TaxID=6412 RepID=T1FMC9_HELRO|nr:hypothetical protein HELRODRAFT_185069 [Helobdella robusta]ESN96164.1 hypothetical protein HELRODRAFT_185069 [Helobdella robusta]